ncbi:MAG: TRAP transporter fused permease subunit [Defluviitaleaceae bacterium]|nr:TRAP transporter fused permease subunit [Defluviitaleaceae bacterium]
MKDIPIVKKLVSVIAFAFAFFYFYTSGFGIFSTGSNLAIFPLAVGVLTMLVKPMRKGKANTWWMDVIDVIIIVGLTASILYWWFQMPVYASTRVANPNFMDQFMGLTLIFLSLEVTRRQMGWVIPIFGLAMIIIIHYAHMLPGMFHHRGIPLRMWLPFIYFTDGIFGTIMSTFAVFITPFMIFGAFLRISGGGEFFVRFCTALAGRVTGGPALIAVIGSATLGSIIGSPVANVAATGQFTIPLMKRVGFKGEFAAAVEASSSVGGTFLPPIMGAAAFILAATTNTPYSIVMGMAIVPALLYFLSVGFQVYFYAKRHNMGRLNEEEMPDWRAELKQGWYYLGSIVAITAGLFMGYSIPRVAFFGCIFLFICSFFRKETRLTPKKLFEIFEAAGKDTIFIGACAATMGIIMSGLTLHGLGLNFSNALLAFSGGSLFILLILVSILGLILGLGLTITAAYILMAIMAAPALIAYGISPVIAHLIVFWLSMTSNVTPPLAVSAIAAAGIVKADPVKTGFYACMLAIFIYIMPFTMAYSPQITSIGFTPVEVGFIIFLYIGVITALACSTQGWLFRNLQIWERAAIGICIPLLMFTHILANMAGLALLVGFSAFLYMNKNKDTTAAAV